MKTNCTLLAKVVTNKKLNTYRILFTFDKFNRLTVRNAVLATGDICSTNYANAEQEILKQITKAQQTLNCANVALLD
jgi:hypothetical protein